jgi:hypothetical protein
VQRHHFSEKQRFDSQRYENPQQAVGMAAAPADTGGCERELLQLCSLVAVLPGWPVRLNAAGHMRDARWLLFRLLADTVLSERSAQTQEGQMHGALHQSPETLRHAVRASHQAAVLTLFLTLRHSHAVPYNCCMAHPAESRRLCPPEILPEPSTLYVCVCVCAEGARPWTVCGHCLRGAGRQFRWAGSLFGCSPWSARKLCMLHELRDVHLLALLLPAVCSGTGCGPAAWTFRHPAGRRAWPGQLVA